MRAFKTVAKIVSARAFFGRMASEHEVKTFPPANGLGAKGERANNWKTPGPAAFNFKSKYSKFVMV